MKMKDDIEVDLNRCVGQQSPSPPGKGICMEQVVCQIRQHVAGTTISSAPVADVAYIVT